MTPHRAKHAPNYTLRRSGNRLVRYCWTCACVAKKKWAAKNHEKVKRIRRESRARHPETWRAYQADYRVRKPRVTRHATST